MGIVYIGTINGNLLFGRDEKVEYQIKKNQEVPGIRQGSNHWDHLIASLDSGDTIEMNKKEAISLTNRARALGYVIVSRKRGKDEILLWFGGLKK